MNRRATERFFEGLKKGVISCGRCKTEQPTNNFSKSPNRRGNRKFHAYCKPCSKVMFRDWAARNPEKIRARRGRAKARDAINPAPRKWGVLARRAADHGLAFMGRSEFVRWWALQLKSCVYCGLGNDASKAMFKKGLGVDRMDNSMGYVTGNIALACHRCNMVKSSHLSFEQMMTVAAMFFRPKVVI